MSVFVIGANVYFFVGGLLTTNAAASDRLEYRFGDGVPVVSRIGDVRIVSTSRV